MGGNHWVDARLFALGRRSCAAFRASLGFLALLCLLDRKAGAQKPQPGVQVFDPGRVAVVKFTMTSETYGRMSAATRLPDGSLQFPYVAADFGFDGQVITNVAVRFKGNSSLRAGTEFHPSLKIDFNDFQADARLDGLKKLNLHNHSTDTSNLAEFLSYEAWRRMGVAAPRTGWAEVWINDRNWGLYTTVEEPGQDFIDEHFGYRQGDLYKPELPGGSLVWRGESITNYTNLNWELQTDTDHSAFLHLVDVINHQPATVLGQVLDLKGVLTYLAGNVALGNGDDYTFLAHNYYLYENSPGHFTFLPWDMNLSQGGQFNLYPSGASGTGSRPLTEKLLQNPLYTQIYLRILHSFLDGAASISSLNARLDYATNVLGSRVSTSAVASLRNNIANRVGNLRNALFLALTNSPTTRLFINEIMADNRQTRRDEAGEFEDWVELYNPGDQPLDLGGMYLTDDPRNTRKWRFPTNSVIPARGHLLLWADEQRGQGPLHLNFKLAKEGEFLGLYDVEERANQLIDAVTFATQTSDRSDGRLPDGDERWLRQLKPTPGTTNDPTDTDHDGLPDAWELMHGLDPNSASDAEADPDADGLSNMREFIGRTNPKAVNSSFGVIKAVKARNFLRLSWPTEEGRRYQVQAASSLENGPWTSISAPVREGFYSEFLISANPARLKYFRVILVE